MRHDAIENGDLDLWLTCGGLETVASYGGDLAHVPPRHVEFLRHCRRFWETDACIFVHANYGSDAPLAGQPDEKLLWEHLVFSMPQPHVSGKIAVVGHTPQLSGEILDMGYLKCIDTYCVGGGRLTALELDSGRLWQATADGQLRRR
jgi:serine/threonine protein phosphatase 1